MGGMAMSSKHSDKNGLHERIALSILTRTGADRRRLDGAASLREPVGSGGAFRCSHCRGCWSGPIRKSALGLPSVISPLQHDRF